MPVYVRAEALEVPTPTLSDCSEDHAQDPEEVFPERTGTAGYAKEVLSEIFNTCWTSVEKKHSERESRARLKVDQTVDQLFATQVKADKFTAVSSARNFVFGGTEAGRIHAYNAEGDLLDTWTSPEEARITDVWASDVEAIESIAHCVATDEMGNAWWLVITDHGLVMVKEVTEDKTKVRCDDCKFAIGGHIIAVSVSTASDSWVVCWKMTPSIVNAWIKTLAPPPSEEGAEHIEAEKIVPNLTMTAAIKILRPRHELKPRKNSYHTMRQSFNIDMMVADITSDENPYLFTDSMKKYRENQEEDSFLSEFPSDRVPLDSELSVMLNGPALMIILEPLYDAAEVVSHTSARNPDANARIHQYGIATTHQSSTKVYVYKFDDVPKGRVLPYQGLPHTDRVVAFGTDCKKTNFIATCCANGTISLWKRNSERGLHPMFVCPSLQNISVIAMAVQPQLGNATADVLIHDLTKALLIVEDDDDKYLSVFNERRVIYDHVEEFHQTSAGYVARLNEISIFWAHTQSQIVRKWMLPATCEDLNQQSYSTLDDCIYYLHGHQLKVARFI